MRTTVDALIEGPSGVDWIQRDEAGRWKELFAELRDADTFLLGRIMYPDYAAHWRGVLSGARSRSEHDLAFARVADATPHVVVSRTGQEHPRLGRRDARVGAARRRPAAARNEDVSVGKRAAALRRRMTT